MPHSERLEAVLAETAFPSKGARTRFRLKIAAARCLEDAGFQDLKIADICARAGLALGSFYVYFPDKATIATEVLLEFGDSLYVQAQLAARGQGDFEAILMTNRFFARAYQLNPGLVRCLIQVEDQVPQFQKQWRERRLRWIESLARSIARRSGGDASDYATYMQVAYALEGMVFHYLYVAYVRNDPVLGNDRQDPDVLAELLAVLWYRAIYREDPPAECLVHAKAVTKLRGREHVHR